MRKADITKQKILKAAEHIFAKKGFYGAGVNEIAAAAGVNKRMIYACFKNKENLYISVVDEAFARFYKAEKSFLNKRLDCTEAVCGIIEHYFKFLHANKSFVKILMRESLNEAAFFKKSNARFIKSEAPGFLKSKLLQGIQSGVFNDDFDVSDMADAIISLCFSFFANMYLAADLTQTKPYAERDTDNMCEFVKKLCLNNIQARFGRIL